MPPSSPYARAIASCAISAPKFSSTRATSFAEISFTANDVALVEENLGAEIAHEAIARAYGDEGGIPRVLHHGPGTTLQVNDGKVAICVHFVAGGVEHGLRQVGARELAHGFHTTRQRKVAHEHVDAVIEVAVDVVDELVILHGKSRASFTSIGTQPGLFSLNRF